MTDGKILNMASQIEIYTDGGSRGNPGPSACAFVVIKEGSVIHEESAFLGEGTNNNAEYQGLINALRWLTINGKQKETVVIYMDSELVVRQVKGIYKVKHPVMKMKHQEVTGLLSQFSHLTFQNVPRLQNAHPDRLVNEELDKRG